MDRWKDGDVEFVRVCLSFYILYIFVFFILSFKYHFSRDDSIQYGCTCCNDNKDILLYSIIFCSILFYYKTSLQQDFVNEFMFFVRLSNKGSPFCVLSPL